MLHRSVALLVLLGALLASAVLPHTEDFDGALASAIRYESEDAHFINSAVLSHNDAKDYSGSGFVDFQVPTDAEYEPVVIYTLNIAEDSMFPLSIAYSSSSDAWVSVKVNGIEQVVSSLSASAHWSTKVESVALRQGLNTIILRGVKLADKLSVDYIEVEGAIPLAVNGATLSYYELEAESANTNGQKIGPNRALYQLATEASGRVAVTINQGQYVEWTLTKPANAIVVRFSIPDTGDGAGQVATLDVLVDGQKALNLTVSSIFSWAYGDYPFSKIPSQGKPHHFYDETRGMFGKTLPAGTKVRVVAVNSIPYTIDLADFYTVPDPYPMPANLISVVANGADPTGKKDSTGAFQNTINMAQSQGKGVWIPQGFFLVTTRFTISKIIVRGAGPWWTTVKGTVNHGAGFFGNFAPNPSVDVQLYDFAVTGDTNVRDDGAVDSGVGGAFNGNSIVQNLWIEHTKCGMWLDGPFNGFHVVGTTIRNTYADGINLHKGISNVVVEQSIFRNVGDDALAMWSEQQADVNNVFKFNTIQVPILANGIALYGGQDNSATDNYVADTICDGGALQIGNRYNSIPLAGKTVFARNTVVRGGAPSRFGPQDCGSVWVWQEQGAFGGTVDISDTTSIDSNFAAVTFWGGNYNNVAITNLNVQGGPYVFEVNSASGSIPCKNVVATGLPMPGVHSCAGLLFSDQGGNTGWDWVHEHQKCN